MNFFLPLLVSFSLVLGIAGNCFSEDWDEAFLFLKNRISSEKRYERLECISFGLTGSKGHVYEIELREKHDASCGGDPDLAPTLDRYQVDLQKKEISRYDSLTDEYLVDQFTSGSSKALK